MTEETLEIIIKRLRDTASLEMSRYYISHNSKSADHSFLKAEIYSELAAILEVS